MRCKKLVLNIMCAILIAILISYSCTKDKLNQPALGLVDEATLANKNGVEGLLIGAYALLDGAGKNVGGPGSAASNWIYGSICGNEAYKGSMPGDMDQINVLSKFTSSSPADEGGNLDSKWRAVYEGITRANAVLRVMRQAKDISPDDTVEIRAEAVFLRAFYHFEAKKMWNNIPLLDETVTYSAGNYYINNDTSWSFIENDFKYAMNNLPPKQSAKGRANKYAAKAFLAKTYMFERKYADAKPLLEDLIQNGETTRGDKYKLVNYADNFNPDTKNSAEAVFSAQASVNDDGYGANGNPGDALNFPFGGGPGACCGFFQPSQWLVNHFKTDPVTGLPDLDHFNDVNPVKNDEGYKSDSLYSLYSGTLDPRLDWTVGRRGVPYLDWGPHPGNNWIRDQGYMGPYAPKKNTYRQSQAGTYTDQGWGVLTANNVNLIRYADILLWAAEVEVETRGDLNKARDYVNQVRARAADPSGWVKNDDNIRNAKRVTYNQADFDSINDASFTEIQPFDWVVRKDLNQTWVLLSVKSNGTKVWNAYPDPTQNYNIKQYTAPWTDPEYARKAIRFERVLELGMEGHRFFDLVRWGIADQEINTYFQQEKTLRDFLKDAPEAKFTLGKNEYFPIPLIETDLSVDAHGVQHLKQNPGYY